MCEVGASLFLVARSIRLIRTELVRSLRSIMCYRKKEHKFERNRSGSSACHALCSWFIELGIRWARACVEGATISTGYNTYRVHATAATARRMDKMMVKVTASNIFAAE